MPDAMHRPPPRVAGITPSPSDEEATAIVTAVEALWPRPVARSEMTDTRDQTAWRFSGRWWATNHVVRRGRPSL